MSPSIQVTQVTKTYGTGATAYRALKGVDFTASPGEFVILSGPSGSGKTTLLSILGCVLSATSGAISLFGEDVSRVPEKGLPRLRLKYIGFVFQAHNLIASLSAIENVALAMQLRGHSRDETMRAARDLLDRVGLAGKHENLPRDLSGGQRQRVAIARAIAGDAPLILADEPTASLDAQNGLACTELLKDLVREQRRTVVCVTHDNRIFHLADRILEMEDGIVRRSMS